jgi:TolA-binding protein
MKNTLLISCLVLPLLGSCGYDLKSEIAKIEHKAIIINRYENVALKLAKENRELHAEVKRLEFDIQKLKQDKAFKTGEESLAKNEQGEHAGRTIASVGPEALVVKKDLVEWKTYKWSAEDMIKMADKEFKDKHFEKAAQFYSSITVYYPGYKHFDDEFYFKAGISSYESGDHHDWTLKHFDALMEKYPTSQYYRSAKLWVALTHMKLGDKQKFFATVEEFRKKYRNTNEWKILSSYYENIEEKTNE